MLTRVEIQNFQSHQNTIVEFVPGTNVIIGASDAGKSAIFRAINWVISNRPLGDSFRSEWGGDTRVTLYTAEGNVVERVRTATRNEYIINGQTIKAFGSEVPEQVLEVLQLDEANIQAQMDVPFLLAVSPGEAARLLNKAASIDDIDLTLSNLKSAHTRLNNDIKTNEARLEKFQEELKEYEDIPILEEKLQWLEEDHKHWNEEQERLIKLTHLVFQIRTVRGKLRKTENVEELIQRYEFIEKMYQDLESRKKRLQQLKRLTEEVRERKEYLKDTEYVDHCLEKVQKALDQYQSYQEKQREVSSLRWAVTKIANVQRGLRLLEEKIKQLEEEFDELCPERCPLCGSEMKGN